jgi:hypothetical protein
MRLIIALVLILFFAPVASAGTNYTLSQVYLKDGATARTSAGS